jgi:hypothetical protein
MIKQNDEVRHLNEVLDRKSKTLETYIENNIFYETIKDLKKDLKNDTSIEQKYNIFIQLGKLNMKKGESTINKICCFSSGFLFQAAGAFFEQAMGTDINKEESFRLCIKAYEKAIFNYDRTEESNNMLEFNNGVKKRADDLRILVARISKHYL